MSYSIQPQSCFKIAFMWWKWAHRWQRQITKGRSSMICKYTTLQLCKAIGKESVGFLWCIFFCSHLDSYSNYNNPHYTNYCIVVFIQKMPILTFPKKYAFYRMNTIMNNLSLGFLTCFKSRAPPFDPSSIIP